MDPARPVAAGGMARWVPRSASVDARFSCFRRAHIGRRGDPTLECRTASGSSRLLRHHPGLHTQSHVDA